MHNRFALNAVLNTIKTTLGLFFPLITYPYITRVLGVENLGIYSFSSSFLSYFTLIAGLGISTYGIREGIQYRENKYKINILINELFSINIISTIIAYFLLFFTIYFIPFFSNYRVTIFILSAEIFFTTLGASWICNLYEDFVIIAIRTIIMQVISLILILIFVKTSNDFYKYIFILLISNSGANLFNYFYVQKKYCKFHFLFQCNLTQHLKPILIIFLTTVAITIYVSSDTTMLGFITNNYQVGLYGTAVKIYTIIKNILAAVLMVMIPQFTFLFSRGIKKSYNELFSKVFNILTVIMLPMCVGLFSLSDDIVLLISGKEFLGASHPLKFLSLAIIFSLYAYMYTQCILIPTRKERVVFKATLISAIVNIGLNFVFIPLWGINAAAFTTIIAEFITFIIAFYNSRNIVSLINVKNNFISVLLGCISILIVCLIFGNIDCYIARIISSILGSIIIYIMILLINKNYVLYQIKDMLSKKKV